MINSFTAVLHVLKGCIRNTDAVRCVPRPILLLWRMLPWVLRCRRWDVMTQNDPNFTYACHTLANIYRRLSVPALKAGQVTVQCHLEHSRSPRQTYSGFATNPNKTQLNTSQPNPTPTSTPKTKSISRSTVCVGRFLRSIEYTVACKRFLVRLNKRLTKTRGAFLSVINGFTSERSGSD